MRRGTSRRIAAAALAAALAIAACAPPSPRASSTLRLSDGRSVELLMMGPFLNAKGPVGLMLQYRTATPITEVVALRREADDIWTRFVVDVEKSGHTAGIIRASSPQEGSGPVTSSRSYTFVYEKKGRVWRTLEDRDLAKTSLDEGAVRAFVGRIDRLIEQGPADALALYLAEGWTQSTTGVPAPEPNIGPARFLAQLRGLAPGALRHSREIVKVTVAADRRSATVESREITEVTRDGKRQRFQEQTVDRVGLEDGSLLWLSSESRLQTEIAA